jgi:stress-induced morphogen
MNENLWKVKMVRLLTTRVSPDVIAESSFEYTLPDDLSNMLDNINMVDEAHHNSIFMEVRQHCHNEHASSGFFAQEIISPKFDGLSF